MPLKTEHIIPHPYFTVCGIPAFKDNYIWLLSVRTSATRPRFTAVIDPGAADPVLRQLQASNLGLDAILITHQHADHVGGIAALRKVYPNIPVYAPAHEPIPQRTHALSGGELLDLLGPDLPLRVLAVPGHTLGHLAYFIDDTTMPAVFCGDTLFAGGCGRVFTQLGGRTENLYYSLCQLARLPPTTRIYCAHEYTLNNLTFAAQLEPTHPAIQTRLQQVQVERQQDQPTIPSTIEMELATNPFLRCHEPALQQRLSTLSVSEKTNSALATFIALRHLKDNFHMP